MKQDMDDVWGEAISGLGEDRLADLRQQALKAARKEALATATSQLMQTIFEGEGEMLRHSQKLAQVIANEFKVMSLPYLMTVSDERAGLDMLLGDAVEHFREENDVAGYYHYVGQLARQWKETVATLRLLAPLSGHLPREGVFEETSDPTDDYLLLADDEMWDGALLSLVVLAGMTGAAERDGNQESVAKVLESIPDEASRWCRSLITTYARLQQRFAADVKQVLDTPFA